MKRFSLALALGAMLTVAMPAALAQQKLKFAHVYEVSEPYHTAAVWAAGEIAKRTGNRYAMEVFPASSLGNETQINQALTLATVDIIYTGQLFAGRAHGPISIGGAPFVFRDFDHWKKYTQSKLFEELVDGYLKGSGGNKVVAITYYGNRQTTSNKPLNRPEDMKGLKIRVPDAPLYTLFPRAVGANPTPIAFRRGVPRAAEQDGRCTGKPSADDRCKEILRGAVAHQHHGPHHRCAADNHRRTAVGQAL
jgi:TRAP-type C4-dicarboxylate transport system substrate-binding protein